MLQLQALRWAELEQSSVYRSKLEIKDFSEDLERDIDDIDFSSEKYNKINIKNPFVWIDDPLSNLTWSTYTGNVFIPNNLSIATIALGEQKTSLSIKQVKEHAIQTLRRFEEKWNNFLEEEKKITEFFDDQL